MPVRWVIQLASKPNRTASSSFVTTLSGTYDPQETICTPNSERVRRLKRRPPAVAGVRCGRSRGVGTGVLDETVFDEIVIDVTGGAATALPCDMFSKDMNPDSTGSRMT